MYCLKCKKVQQGKANFSNVRKHFTCHKSSEGAAADANPLTKAFAAVASMAVAESNTTTADKLDARGLLALSMLRFMPKHTIEQAYSGDSFDIAVKLAKYGAVVPAGGTVDCAVSRGSALLHDEVKLRLTDRTFVLMTDEANTKLAGRKRPLAILAGCSAIGKPICLDVVFDVDSAGADAALDAELNADALEDTAAVPTPALLAARSIAAILREVNPDWRRYCTGIVGDGAPFNDALARFLGLPRLHCISHQLALVLKKICNPFAEYRTVTRDFSAILNAGGGVGRDAALRRAHVVPERCKNVATRWGQAQETAEYLLSEVKKDELGVIIAAAAAPVDAEGAANALDEPDEDSDPHIVFDVIRTVVGTDKSFTVGTVANEEDDADVTTSNKRTPLKALLAAFKKSLECGVLPDSRKYDALMELHIVKALTTCTIPAHANNVVIHGANASKALTIVELIRLSGADPTALDVHLPEYLANWRKVLVNAAKPGFQSAVLGTAFGTIHKDFSAAEKLVLTAKYVPLIAKAAADALAQYDATVPVALAKLEHRLRFEPRLQPQPFEVAAGTQLDIELAQRFFGALPDWFTLQVVVSWNDYVEAWPTIDNSLKRLGAGLFWNQPRIISQFGVELCKLGSWYSDHPTSNLACERFFGILRGTETPQRLSMSELAVKQELMAKNNSWILDDLLRNCNSKFT